MYAYYLRITLMEGVLLQLFIFTFYYSHTTQLHGKKNYCDFIAETTTVSNCNGMESYVVSWEVEIAGKC